jgi:putative ATP-dependent DNA ligase
MNIQEIERIAEFFNTTGTRIRGLLNRKTLQITPAGHLILDKSISHVESGTALFLRPFEVIRGFPKIQRAMMLEPALKAHFTCDRVAVEEKMNGYNVRVALINGEILALTRGGHICPYSTEKARILIPPRVFKEHPEWVLCGELVGPDSPHVPKDVYGIESLDFFLFDIREKNTGIPLPVPERHEIAEKYGIKNVRLFGVFETDKACEEIQRIIRRLGEQGREGVVIKDVRMKEPPLKYTCSESNCKDLEYAFTYFHDYGRSFFYSRIIREAFQSVEWKESEDEVQRRCKRLGESLLKPMIESIRKVEKGERLSEDVRIRVKSLETAERFKEHLRLLGVDAIFQQPEKMMNGDYLIRIRKVNQSTTDKTQALLRGDTW